VRGRRSLYRNNDVRYVFMMYCVASCPREQYCSRRYRVRTGRGGRYVARVSSGLPRVVSGSEPDDERFRSRHADAMSTSNVFARQYTGCRFFFLVFPHGSHRFSGNGVRDPVSPSRCSDSAPRCSIAPRARKAQRAYVPKTSISVQSSFVRVQRAHVVRILCGGSRARAPALIHSPSSEQCFLGLL